MTTALVPVSTNGHRNGTRRKKTNHIPPEMWKKAVEMFVERRVLTPDELDNELAKLAEEVEGTAKTGAGRDRRKNLVDHVKRLLVQKGAARKLESRGRRYYYWWPVCGEIHNVDHIMTRYDATKTLTEIVRRLDLDPPLTPRRPPFLPY